jgi:hypothetical protein
MATLFAFTRGPFTAKVRARQAEWGDVCSWHKADITIVVNHVRFWG